MNNFVMNKDIRSYILNIKGIVEKDKCQEIIEQIEKIKWEEHKFYNPQKQTFSNRSGDQEFEMSWMDIELKEYLMDKIWQSFYIYLEHLNIPWFNSWQSFSSVRFNRYSESKKMAQHVDHIHSLFDGERKGIPVLTSLGLLNDNFSGGDLIFFGDEKIDFEQGDILVFPSIFLYPHLVEPVTSGTRYSYVSWAW